MSVLKRLTNVARGKVLEWQRGPSSRPEPDELVAEEPARRPRPLRADDDDDDEAVPRPEPADPREGTPARPKKRRL